MALRWKKNPMPAGLARVACGPQGSTLRDGDEQYARTYAHRSRDIRSGWYWTARNDERGVPHMNTCAVSLPDEETAKLAALDYVRKHLNNKD